MSPNMTVWGALLGPLSRMLRPQHKNDLTIDEQKNTHKKKHKDMKSNQDPASPKEAKSNFLITLKTLGLKWSA